MNDDVKTDFISNSQNVSKKANRKKAKLVTEKLNETLKGKEGEKERESEIRPGILVEPASLCALGNAMASRA